MKKLLFGKMEEDARAAAGKIIADAQLDADGIIADARRVATEIKASAQAEAQQRIVKAEAKENRIHTLQAELDTAVENHSATANRLTEDRKAFAVEQDRVRQREEELEAEQKDLAEKTGKLAELRTQLKSDQDRLEDDREKLEEERLRLTESFAQLAEDRAALETLRQSTDVPEGAPNSIRDFVSPIQGPHLTTNPSEMIDRSDHVRVPNATVQAELRYDLRNYHPKLADVRVINVGPDDRAALLELGLQLNDTILSGTPLTPGDYQFPLDLGGNSLWAEKGSLELHLLVNDDPRNMWKDLPTDPSAPFPKPDTDIRTLATEHFTFVGASRRGRSHAHKGTFRDDDFAITPLESGWTLLAVSDGAGSSRFSREASRVLCQRIAGSLRGDWPAFEAHVNNHLAGDLTQLADAPREFKTDVYSSVIGKAVLEASRALDGLTQEHEGTTIKDFYATLLFTIVAPVGERGAAVVSFGLGDGAMALLHGEDGVTLLNTPDGGDFAGQTVFLTPANVAGGTNVWQRIRYDFTEDCRGLYLMTDGVSDPFFPADADLASADFWTTFTQDLREGTDQTTPGAAAETTLEWLHFFRKGHHDDRTLVYATRKVADKRKTT